MNNTSTYRVAYGLYASARTNIIPKPGTISLDEKGMLTLLDTSSNQIIVQKSLSEIAGVRPKQLIHFYKHASGTYNLILYINHNEAYSIYFGSEDAVLNSGIDIYNKLLSGDKAAAIEKLKENNIANADKGKIKSAIHKANDDYVNFIAKAKEAGVYKSAFSSAPFITSTIVFIVVMALLLFAFLELR